MYLRSLSLRDFAGLGAAALEGFEPGLNVVVGDNEAGKSTLLMALRAAFFQKHRATGEAARALAPYGRQVRPEITVGFDLGGVGYTLKKGFLSRPEASLAWPGGELSSDAVEERLAELLGFAHPGRGESKLGEHQGAFGLLWVEQGRSHENDLDLGVGRNAVTASLEGEIGQILGGDRGRALLAAAKGLQDRFFTGSGRIAASSPLKQAEETLTALQTELLDRKAAHRDYEEKIDRLKHRRDTLAAYLGDDAEGRAERAVEAAEEKARAVAGHEAAHDRARQELGHAEAGRAAAFERLTARRRLAEQMAEAGRLRDLCAAALDDLLRAEAADLADLARLDAARAAARAAHAVAEQGDEAASAGAEHRRLSAERAALERRRAEAAAVETRLEALVRQPAVLDRKALERLEEAERARREAEIRVAATAPSLLFQPSAGQRVRGGDGAAIDTATARPVLERSVFDLDGFGRITVEPGQDAGELARTFADAESALAALFARHRVASLDEARRLVGEGEERKAEIARLKTQLAAILPDGTAAAVATLSALAVALDRLGPDAGANPASGEVPVDPERARALRKDAKTRLDAAESSLDAARKHSAAFAARRAKAEAEAENRAAAAVRLAAESAAADGRRGMAALEEDLAAAELDRSAKAALLALRLRALGEADPETAARTLQARRRALDEIRRTVAGLRNEAAMLEGELRAQGLGALGEDIQRLEEEIETLGARRRRLALEADAAKLLHAALTGAEAEAREHWLGPIKAEVAPYLRLIHPESEIAFDDATLAITGLNRRGVAEEFKRLSAGAREQVAVVTRIALAGVLRRGGHPALVILDDALVNTDEKRLERMHLVLQRAAETMQIIVLTCRERDFRDLGGKLFRL